MSKDVKSNEDNDMKFFTAEFFGVTLIITGFLLLICLLFGRNVLFDVGEEIQFFLLGIFGYTAFPVLVCLCYVGFMILLGKKTVKGDLRKKIIILILFLISVICLLNVITGVKETFSLSNYLSSAYLSGRKGLEGVFAGGALFSIITYPFVRYAKFIGSIIIFSAIILAFLYFTIFKRKIVGSVKISGEKEYPSEISKPTPSVSQPAESFNNINVNQGAQFSTNNDFNSNIETPTENSVLNSNYQNDAIKQNGMEILYGDRRKPVFSGTYSDAYSKKFKEDLVQIQNSINGKRETVQSGGNVSEPISKETVKPIFNYDENPPLNSGKAAGLFDDIEKENENFDEDKPVSKNFFDAFKKNKNENAIKKASEEISEESDNNSQKTSSSMVEATQIDIFSEKQKIIENMPKNYKFTSPPMSLYTVFDNTANNFEYEKFKSETYDRIVRVLKTFGVDVKIQRVLRGPSLTRYDMEIPENVPMSKVVKLADDINLRVAARSSIRMIAPVPNTNFIGIEVPNPKTETVGLRDIISCDKFINSKKFSLTCALGKDVVGNPVVLDIADAPHILLTGTTGSGKSVALNAMLLSLISKYGPEEFRLIVVDPKRVSFNLFLGAPQFLFNNIIEDLAECNAMLTWVVEEMDNRYKLLNSRNVKDIKVYNEWALKIGERIMPRIVVIIDEFADLMLQDKKGIGTKICLLAQKSRACGIHLILAAQRPSVDIIDGPIKSNLPTRIVLRAASLPDSMTCLGEGGAEKLLGHGDCLYKTSSMLSVERIQCAFDPDEEITNIVDYLKENNESYFDVNTYTKIKAACSAAENNYDDESSPRGGEVSTEDKINGDELNLRALKLAVQLGNVSATLLQRKLAIGYPRAGKILDWMENNNYISPITSGNKRQVYITKEQFAEKFGDIDE